MDHSCNALRKQSATGISCRIIIGTFEGQSKVSVNYVINGNNIDSIPMGGINLFVGCDFVRTNGPGIID